MINVDDLFDYTSFNIDHEPHIVLDPEHCASCGERACTTTCPARCYSWSEQDQKMTFVYVGCLECGRLPGGVRRLRSPAGAIRGAATGCRTG